MREERALGREKQRLFEEVVPDAFSDEFEQYGNPAAETSQALEWMLSWLPPQVLREILLEDAQGQLQPARQAAFIRGKHITKCFFDRSNVKLIGNMAWFMVAWETPHELCDRNRLDSEEALQLVLGLIKKSIGL